MTCVVTKKSISSMVQSEELPMKCLLIAKDLSASRMEWIRPILVKVCPNILIYIHGAFLIPDELAIDVDSDHRPISDRSVPPVKSTSQLVEEIVPTIHLVVEIQKTELYWAKDAQSRDNGDNILRIHNQARDA